MPLTRTLLQLRTDARRCADQEGSEFCSDAEVDRYVNLGLAELWHVLVQSDMDRYLTDTEVTTTAGTYEYALPSDFAAARTLEKREASGSERAYRLEPYNLSEGHDGDHIGHRGRGLRWTVLRQGQDGTAGRLRFSADPGSGYFRLWYIQQPPVLVNDGDTFDGVAMWEEFAVLWAAEQMMAKEESDPSALIRRRAELTTRIQQLAGSRVIGSAPSVARVRHRRGGRW